MRAFITGSQVYGIPHDKSDIDLVVLITERELERMLGIVTPEEIGSADPDYLRKIGSIPLKFGRLNLLLCVSKHTYDLWVEGTKALKKKAPVPRDFAVEFFARLRDKRRMVDPNLSAIGPDAKRRSEDDGIPF